MLSLEQHESVWCICYESIIAIGEFASLTLDVSLIQDGATALYVTSQLSNNDVIQLLLDSGASVDKPNKV